MRSVVLPAATVSLEPAPLDPSQIVAGDPQASALDLLSVGGLTVGVWEHTPGVSTDVEADEVFVVLAGRASVAIEGAEALELAPGDVCVLEAGARTTWTVHETLRKVYLAGGPVQPA